MSNQDRIIKKYNEGQDIIKVKSINIEFRGDEYIYFQKLKNDKIPKNHKALLDHESIGFYEFIFNPKYKVFEVFIIQLSDVLDYNGLSGRILGTKKPAKIIDYLAEVKG